MTDQEKHWVNSDDMPEQPTPHEGCPRCNTPKKCAVHGCSPMTWPSEAALEQEPVPPMLLRDVANIADASGSLSQSRSDAAVLDMGKSRT